MSQRPGILESATAYCAKPAWNDPNVPDPRSNVPMISAEIRAHWPIWATRAEAEAALDAVYEKAKQSIAAKFAEDGAQ